MTINQPFWILLPPRKVIVIVSIKLYKKINTGRAAALPIIQISEESSHLIHTFPHKVDRGMTVQIHSDLNS